MPSRSRDDQRVLAAVEEIHPVLGVGDDGRLSQFPTFGQLLPILDLFVGVLAIADGGHIVASSFASSGSRLVVVLGYFDTPRHSGFRGNDDICRHTLVWTSNKIQLTGIRPFKRHFFLIGEHVMRVELPNLSLKRRWTASICWQRPASVKISSVLARRSSQLVLSRYSSHSRGNKLAAILAADTAAVLQ